MRALLIVGSPKQAKSISEALGSALLQRLQDRGMYVDKRYTHRAVKSRDKLEEMVRVVADADLVIFASPLYVDSLPAPVIAVLESLATGLDQYARPAGQRLVAISNSGFPESVHNDTALAIYQQFARETNLQYAGGLALGGGGPVQSQSLEEGSESGMARNVVKALDLAADGLASGGSVGAEAEALMREPLMPAKLYRFMGNLGWWMQAGQNGVFFKLRHRPW